MPGSELTIRELHLSDIADAVKLCREEEWATSYQTIRSQIEHFGLETFIAGYSQDGVIVAICAVYRLSECISFLDFVIVAKSHRRQGIATRLIQTALEKVKDTNVVLDSNPQYVSLYSTKFGFQIDQSMYETKISFSNGYKSHKFQQELSVKSVTKDNIKEVMDYDKSLHPLGHRSYFEQMLLDKNNTSLCSVVDGKVNGLLEYSPSERLLNALYADSQSVAGNLLATLFWLLSGTDSQSQSTTATKIHLSLPEMKVTHLTQCLEELGLQYDKPTIDSVRMVSKEKVQNVAYDRVYSMMYDVYII